MVESRITRDDSDTENIMFSVPGAIEDDGTSIFIKYIEQDDDMQTENVLSFKKSDRGAVDVSRRGGVSSLMHFKAGHRHNWRYDAGFVALDFCTVTSGLVNTIEFDRGGTFCVDYSLENSGTEMQKVRFSVLVK